MRMDLVKKMDDSLRAEQGDLIPLWTNEDLIDWEFVNTQISLAEELQQRHEEGKMERKMATESKMGVHMTEEGGESVGKSNTESEADSPVRALSSTDQTKSETCVF